nr:hypothetical protein [uncultured Sphingomonas sp.]
MSEFRAAVKAALKGLPLDAPELKAGLQIHGLSPQANFPGASNGKARVWLGQRFIKLMVLFKEANPSLNFHFITMFHRDWETTDKEGLLLLGDLHRRVRGVLEKLELHGMFVAEIQAATTHRRGLGRKLLLHVHGIVWTQRELDTKALNQQMRRSRRLTSSNDANPFRISKPLMSSRALAMRAYYLFKAPISGKYMERGRYKRTKKLRPDLALRLSELLSSFTLAEAIIGCGSGAKLRSELLNPWRRLFPSPADDLEVARYWRRLNKVRRTKYPAVRIQRRGAAIPPRRMLERRRLRAIPGFWAQ